MNAGVVGRDDVGDAQARLQPLRDRDQQPVRHQRPEAVADVLEPVEAEHEQRKRVLGAPLHCA